MRNSRLINYVSKMTDPQIAAYHVKHMSKLLHYWKYLYYHCSVSIVTDFQFDRLFQALEIIEEKFPELVVETSPTKVVGWNKEAFPEVAALEFDKEQAIMMFLYPVFVPDEKLKWGVRNG